MRGPSVTRLNEPMVVTRGEIQNRLSPGGLDHLSHVAHDQRPARKTSEIDGLEMGEQRIVALDVHDALVRRDRVALVKSANGQLGPAGYPLPLLVVPAGAELQNRDRLVDAPQHRIPLLEYLHDDTPVLAFGLEQLLREVEVGVGVVALPDLLDGEAEDLGVESLTPLDRPDDRHREMDSKWRSPPRENLRQNLLNECTSFSYTVFWWYSHGRGSFDEPRRGSRHRSGAPRRDGSRGP